MPLETSVHIAGATRRKSESVNYYFRLPTIHVQSHQFVIHEYLLAPCVLASIAGGTLLDAGCDSNHLTQLCVVSWMVYNVHEMTCNIQ